MVVPKYPVGSYSDALRRRRFARIRSGESSPPADAVRIGRWVMTEEEGALIIINQMTEARTVLAEEGVDDGAV